MMEIMIDYDEDDHDDCDGIGYTLFLEEHLVFLLSLNILKIFGFEPEIFLNFYS